MPRSHTLDGRLRDWADISESAEWSGILVGNGASRAVWDRFAYGTLYERATSNDIAHPLTAEDTEFFDAAGATGNFEAVLGALTTARVVCDILGQDSSRIAERYQSIRQALVEAVQAVHIPWMKVPEENLIRIRNALREYEFVYSTNYDLLIYWSIMAENDGAFRDYFWGESFDVSDTDIWKPCTKVLYLHGGLHLYRDLAGGTIKDRADAFTNLLDKFGKRPDAVPLFVSEGGARSKLRSITSSDYLSFAYQQFGSHQGPLVIFGQGLSDVDAHISDVIARWSDRTIAYGMLDFGTAQTIQQKARIVGKLPDAELHFFDASTHPLGDPALKVQEDV